MYYRVEENTIEDIADAIRTQSGASGDIKVEDFAQAILSLDIGEDTNSAAESASKAAASAVSAASSATAASEISGNMASMQENTKQFADNAEQSAQESVSSAQASAQSAAESNTHCIDSEAWAVGKRSGVDVDAEDITYQNNAKYWAEFAKETVTVESMEDSDIQNIWDSVFA